MDFVGIAQQIYHICLLYTSRLQSVAVDAVHIIFQGMPVFVESGFLAVLNDIDGRDACVPEHKKVVGGTYVEEKADCQCGFRG